MHVDNALYWLLVLQTGAGCWTLFAVAMALRVDIVSPAATRRLQQTFICCVCASVRLYGFPSVPLCLSVCPSVCLSICPYVHKCVCPSVRLSGGLAGHYFFLCICPEGLLDIIFLCVCPDGLLDLNLFCACVRACMRACMRLCLSVILALVVVRLESLALIERYMPLCVVADKIHGIRI